MKNLKTILTLVTRSMSAFFFETNRLAQKNNRASFYRALQKASFLSGPYSMA